MRHLSFSARAVYSAGAFALVLVSTTAVPAANAQIDPVPGSLTLGEIMDREQWNNGPRAPLLPVRAAAEPVAEATPFPAHEAPIVQAPASAAAPRVVRQVYPVPKR